MKPPIREKLPSDPIAALLALAHGRHGSTRKLRKPSETVRRLKRKSFGKSKRPVRHDER
jgi:hypothetical protein